ncbi:MAG: iron-sulfur cluster-binding protein [Azospirillum sp.]|nr:iron-sulfur cluster-binding protein [Azospirillum sp.]
MHPTSHDFKDNARRALDDVHLQTVMGVFRGGFVDKRKRAMERLPEFDQLRDQARDLKNHILENLDHYLERFEAKVVENGGQVHWCRTPAEARETVLELCRAADAKTVSKGKSMVAEEIGLNDYLEEHGVVPIETDLGEYIIQLRREPPSHIIVPAIHLTKGDVADTFREHHTDLKPDRNLGEARDLVNEARAVLRQKFIAADVGITGANFLIAETGSTVIVTNEGNGDLTQCLPRVHIVVTGLEKVVPTLEDASTLIRLLARSATGQEMSCYTTFSTGPRRAGDLDGPEQFHVVLVDNGRTSLLGTEFHEVLRCIRCGACMNHCPVYNAIGGHAYGWVYPGPIGSVLDPALIGLAEAHHLPNASTFCGRCEAVCPVHIPLPNMMRQWRFRESEQKLSPPALRYGLGFWGFFATKPALYHFGTGIAMTVLGLLGRAKGRFRSLPGAKGWTDTRDMPAPEGGTFQQRWAQRQRKAG